MLTEDEENKTISLLGALDIDTQWLAKKLLHTHDELSKVHEELQKANEELARIMEVYGP